MGKYYAIHMISPPLHVVSEGISLAVYGWAEINGTLEPIVSNPDGPGIGAWHLYYGEDSWEARA